MKGPFLGYVVLCIFLAKTQSKPQITKLFPVRELATFHQRTNEVKPLEKLLGKLRATYNFVFSRPKDTSNVQNILSKDHAADPADVEAVKHLWAQVSPRIAGDEKKPYDAEDRAFDETEVRPNRVTNEVEKTTSSKEASTTSSSADDWLDDIEAPKPLDQLELQDDENDDGVVEVVTPQSTLHLPATLGQHLLEWLGSLLGLTYGVYSKVARVLKSS